jgi:hypothetical protein
VTSCEVWFGEPKADNIVLLGVGRYRSLQEFYEVTENLNDDLTLYCHFADCEPIDFEEVGKDEKWINVMDEEIKAFEKNNTWELTTIPKEQKPIGVKWVFKEKKNAKGEVEGYKARLVVKGYSQRPDIVYGEVFDPVHNWSKHIDTRYHFIRECIIKKEVQLKLVNTHDQVTDIFTNPLKNEIFCKLRAKFKRGC